MRIEASAVIGPRDFHPFGPLSYAIIPFYVYEFKWFLTCPPECIHSDGESPALMADG
jgi:hypothetical protein